VKNDIARVNNYRSVVNDDKDFGFIIKEKFRDKEQRTSEI